MKVLKNILCAALLLWGAFTVPAAASDGMEKDQVLIRTTGGEEYIFNVEMALDSGDQRQGLMDRTSLDENAGMLFVFDDERKLAFWMKNTLIPLDMLFVAKDGTIHHIHHSAVPQDLTRITSERPAMAVLEINGGMSDTLGIKEGDMIIHPVFRNASLGAPAAE